ncbi:MAG TPA: hypothetical protein VMG59_00280 [Phycisphaerae bacterium]|nr:hypothetical protein [Phycisphaerae bacterium]
MVPGATSASQPAAEEVQLQRMLANNLTLSLKNVSLTDAFSAIARSAHISIEVEQSVYNCLPYGDDTIIDVAFRDVPLQTALQKIMDELCLSMAVSNQHVVIEPSEALVRIGRRATWNELDLLHKLNQVVQSQCTGDWSRDLQKLLDQPDIDVVLSPTDASERAMAISNVQAQLPCPIAQSLDAYTQSLHMIWYLSDNRIFIQPGSEWIRQQLSRPIILKQSNVPLQQVVSELSMLSGVDFRPQPGLYLAVPTVNVDSNDGTILQTLDALSGATGITYQIMDDYVLLDVVNNNSSSTPNHEVNQQDPVVGMIPIPTGVGSLQFDYFVHASDVPPSLLAQLHAKAQEVISSIASGTVPTTHPAK